MAKFNYKKWITENKYGKLPEYRDENPFDKEEMDPKDPRQFQRYQEVEKDPDAQAAAPKGEKGEKEKARDFFNQILINKQANQNIISQSQARLRRLLSE